MRLNKELFDIPKSLNNLVALSYPITELNFQRS